MTVNPYLAPATLSEKPAMPRPVRGRALRGLIGLQFVVILISLAVEAIQHETITGIGPVISLVGLAIAVHAKRRRDVAALVFGASPIALSLLVVFLINFNGWGPPQGDQPITLLAWIYSALALPVALWLILARTPYGSAESMVDGDVMASSVASD